MVRAAAHYLLYLLISKVTYTLARCVSIQESPAEARVTRDSTACIKTPDKIILSSSMLPVDFFLMVNSIRGRILLIVCDIFLRKEAENRHFGRYSDAKTAVYPFKIIQKY